MSAFSTSKDIKIVTHRFLCSLHPPRPTARLIILPLKPNLSPHPPKLPLPSLRLAAILPSISQPLLDRFRKLSELLPTINIYDSGYYALASGPIPTILIGRTSLASVPNNIQASGFSYCGFTKHFQQAKYSTAAINSKVPSVRHVGQWNLPLIL